MIGKKYYNNLLTSLRYLTIIKIANIRHDAHIYKQNY